MDYLQRIDSLGIETFGFLNDKNISVLCPFHPDHNPSGEIHIESGGFYCFSCNASGSFVDYLTKELNISRSEALLLVDDCIKIDNAINTIEQDLLTMFEDEKKENLCIKKSWFDSQFPLAVNSLPVMDYLMSRKLTRDTVFKFDCRVGLKDEWKDRVIIPIYNTKGKILTWVGRHVGDGKPKTRKPKSGSTTLFGLYNLVRYNQEKLPYIIIVEGEFDCMWLQQCGYNAVSCMGSANLTDAQIALLYQYTDLVILSYDGDDAGIKATGKSFKDLRQIVPTIPIKFPQGKDPNDLSEEEINDLYSIYTRGLL